MYRHLVPACMNFRKCDRDALSTPEGGTCTMGCKSYWHCENGNVTERGVEAGVRTDRDEFGHTLEDACCRCGGGIPGNNIVSNVYQYLLLSNLGLSTLNTLTSFTTKC